MTGILYQIISMLAFGTSNALWRKPINELDVNEAILFRTFHSVLFFVVLLFAFDRIPLISKGLTTVTYANDVGFTFAVSAVSFFGLFFFNKALKSSPVGIVATVATVTFLIGQLVAFVILKEQFTISFLIPLALFFITILLSDYPTVLRFKISKGIGYGILAAIFWGATLPLLSIPSNSIGFIETGLILELTVLIMSFLSYRVFRKKRIKFRGLIRFYYWFLLLGLLSGTGVLFMNLSYTEIPVHIAGAISSSTHLITIFVAWLLFRERLNRIQLSAAFTAFAAVYYIIAIL